MKKVTALQEGTLLIAKQMQGSSRTAFPSHTASAESMLVITKGRCIIEFDSTSHTLTAGDAFVVPPGQWHQVTGDPDFTAVHVMPRDIRFDFRERPGS